MGELGTRLNHWSLSIPCDSWHSSEQLVESWSGGIMHLVEPYSPPAGCTPLHTSQKLIVGRRGNTPETLRDIPALCTPEGSRCSSTPEGCWGLIGSSSEPDFMNSGCPSPPSADVPRCRNRSYPYDIARIYVYRQLYREDTHRSSRFRASIGSFSAAVFSPVPYNFA